MAYYHACVGCKFDKATCHTLAAFKMDIEGLGITSVKWKCKDRVPRFAVGQAVWAQTMVDYGDAQFPEVVREEWPGHIVRLIGSRALVFIKPGSPPKDYGEDEAPFEPLNGGRGFCKLPLSRLTERDAPQETICPSCEYPAFVGHQEGYFCHDQLARSA